MKRFSALLLLAAVISGTAIFFRESLTNFFFQDDFFNLTLARSQNLLDVFNIFKRPLVDFPFYRPLTTQLFWNVGWQMFVWNQAGYHVITFIFFIINIILVYHLAALLAKSRLTVFLATVFYAFSASHFYRLFFLSQFQEIALGTFVFLTLILYIKGSRLSLLGFALALMSKETAVVLPLALVAYDLLFRRKLGKLLIAHCLLLIVYLWARFIFFGFASGGAYAYDFSPKQILNNYFWYGLWSLGIPEAFVNLKLFLVTQLNDLGQFEAFHLINPEIFTAFGIWGGPIVMTFGLLMLTILLSVRKTTLEHLWQREAIFTAVFFIFSLLPVAFFPFHKFAYSLTLPLFGISYLLATVFSDMPARFLLAAISFYFLLSFFSFQYNFLHHWATAKAYTAQTAFAYFQENFPDISKYRNIYVQNDERNFCSRQKVMFGLSQEVAYGLGGSEGLRLLYNKPGLEVYYDDWDKGKHLFADSLVLDARLFLRR